jgi:Zn-dependent protease with chaperone function
MIHFNYILALLLGLGTIGIIALKMNKNTKFTPKIDVLDPQKDQKQILNTVKALCADGLCVETALKEELSQEHDRLFKEVMKAYPIAQKQWQKTIGTLQAVISADTLISDKPVIKHKKGDLKIVQRSREILAEYNIDPARVVIKTAHNPNIKTNAASFQGFDGKMVIHELELNIPQLKQHPHDVQEAIIRHEIMHLLNYDPLERAYLEELLMKNGITQEQFMQEPAMLNLYKHQEFTADLMAGCHGVCTAQSFQKDFEHYIKTRPEDQIASACITHPSDVERHKAMTQLLSYLEAENQIAMA